MLRLASLIYCNIDKLRVNFISLSVKRSVESNMQVLKNLIDQMEVNSMVKSRRRFTVRLLKEKKNDLQSSFLDTSSFRST